MEVLAIIRDKDIFPGYKEQKINYQVREASRAVIFDKSGQIAVLHVAQGDYYKLPGGGLEKGESQLAALLRECLEETGCYLQNIFPLGETLEYRDQKQMMQRSYCYGAEVKGDKGEPSFDKGERAEGFRVEWMDLDEALKIFSRQQTDDYQGQFVVRRELVILQKAKALHAQKNK